MINEIFVDHGSLWYVRRQTSVAAFEKKTLVLIGDITALLDDGETAHQQLRHLPTTEKPSSF